MYPEMMFSLFSSNLSQSHRYLLLVSCRLSLAQSCRTDRYSLNVGMVLQYIERIGPLHIFTANCHLAGFLLAEHRGFLALIHIGHKQPHQLHSHNLYYACRVRERQSPRSRISKLFMQAVLAQPCSHTRASDDPVCWE